MIEPLLNAELLTARNTVNWLASLDYKDGWPKTYSDEIALDTETTGLNPRKDFLVGISLSQQAKQGYATNCLDAGPLVRVITNKPTAKIVAHNWQFDGPILKRYGWDLECSFDTMLAAYILCREKVGLKWLSKHELDIEMQGIDNLIQKKYTMADVPWSLTVPYAAADADITLQLKHKFQAELEAQPELMDLFQLEMDVMPLLMRMTDVGVKIDIPYLIQMKGTIYTEKNKYLRQIHELVGDPEFNPDSPAQMSYMLFTKLGLEPIRSTDTPGQFSTSKEILEELRGDHPLIDLTIEYRRLRTLLKTFIEKLPGVCDEDGRLRPEWRQTVIPTGRVSSSPNCQNIPVRGAIGSAIRKAFIAEPGFCFVGADYSSLEVRILAHLSQDERLCDVIIKGMDAHRTTASYIFNLPYEDDRWRSEWAHLRDLSKTIFFAIIYGASEWKVAQLIRPIITVQEATSLVESRGSRVKANTDAYVTLAKLVIRGIYKLYPGVLRWKESNLESTRKLGYAQSLYGRRRYLPYITHPSRKARAGAERIAGNHPIQATAGDIMKRAMRDIYNTFKNEDWYHPWGQIHDELQDEIPLDKAEMFKWTKTEIMSNVVSLDVPLAVEAKVGSSWSETH